MIKIIRFVLIIISGIGCAGMAYVYSFQLMTLSNIANDDNIMGVIIFLTVPLYFIGVIFYAFDKLTKSPVKRYLLLMYSCSSGVLFWAFCVTGFSEYWLKTYGFIDTLKMNMEGLSYLFCAFVFLIVFIVNELSILRNKKSTSYDEAR